MAKHVLDAARDFRIGSEILGAQFGKAVFPLRTTVTSMALAAELYLKFLAMHARGDFRRSHDLAALYADLPELSRSSIIAAYKGSRPVPEILRENQDLFVEWRYIFEKQGGSFMIALRDLRLVVNALEAAAQAALDPGP